MSRKEEHPEYKIAFHTRTQPAMAGDTPRRWREWRQRQRNDVTESVQNTGSGEYAANNEGRVHFRLSSEKNKPLWQSPKPKFRLL